MGGDSLEGSHEGLKDMDETHIQEITAPGAGEWDVEIVERKGLGHPDSICDAVMERVSQALSQAYIQRCGRILHHNCDKGLLVAGQVERKLGGGRVVEPMCLIIGDRATDIFGKERLDITQLAVESAKSWFRKNLPRVDPDRHLRYQVELKPGSQELASLFLNARRVLGANDTSAAVGYAPLTETERLVFDAEHFLNSPIFKSRFPETGEDVKVMGVRRKDHLDLTVAMPFLDQHIENEKKYFDLKEATQDALLAYLQSRLKRLNRITVNLNSLDRRGAGMEGMYLSVLGTSAEDGDSGEVGRGNQVNGIIALNRPRGSEAAAGKNPVSHVGKIYSVMSHLMAERLLGRISDLLEVMVWLCSRIGAPIDQPQMVSVQVRLRPGVTIADVADPIRRGVAEELERMPDFCQDLANGRHPVC